MSFRMMTRYRQLYGSELTRSTRIRFMRWDGFYSTYLMAIAFVVVPWLSVMST
jgi:hypothetical protein